jgi:hypothetical protein
MRSLRVAPGPSGLLHMVMALQRRLRTVTFLTTLRVVFLPVWLLKERGCHRGMLPRWCMRAIMAAGLV